MAIIGGVAVAFHGNPRLTNDVDAVVFVDESKLVEFLKLASKHGIIPRIAGALEFAQINRVLLLKDKATGTGIDVALGALAFEERMLKRARPVRAGGLNLPVACVEDITVMKAFAHRGKDLADIESMLEANPKLDLILVRKELTELAELRESPEILTEFESLLANWRRRAK
jgi:hypothetical protein